MEYVCCITSNNCLWYKEYTYYIGNEGADSNGRHGRDRIVVGFTTIYAIGAYHH
jgi:hypothetical protein